MLGTRRIAGRDALAVDAFVAFATLGSTCRASDELCIGLRRIGVYFLHDLHGRGDHEDDSP